MRRRSEGAPCCCIFGLDTSTFTSQNYRNQLQRDFSKPHNGQIRVDHRISDDNTLFGRFLHQRQRNPDFESRLPGTLGMRVQNRKVRHALLSDTHIFSPTLINELRFGISCVHLGEGPRR